MKLENKMKWGWIFCNTGLDKSHRSWLVKHTSFGELQWNHTRCKTHIHLCCNSNLDMSLPMDKCNLVTDKECNCAPNPILKIIQKPHTIRVKKHFFKYSRWNGISDFSHFLFFWPLSGLKHLVWGSQFVTSKVTMPKLTFWRKFH